MRLSPEQIYQLARSVGFPPDTAVTMTAIALKESGGNPTAYNGSGCDDSYGLWQINMIDDPTGRCNKGKPYMLGQQRRAQFGISQNKELWDSHVNARAAYLIWGGNDRNLDTAWYIYKDPMNNQRYLANLPTAQAAGRAVEPGAFDGGAPVILANTGDTDTGTGIDLEPEYWQPVGTGEAGQAGQDPESGAASIPTAALIALAAAAAFIIIDQ